MKQNIIIGISMSLAAVLILFGCERSIGDGARFVECDSFVFGYWSTDENMIAVGREMGLISVGFDKGNGNNKDTFGAYSEEESGLQRYREKSGGYGDAGYDTVYCTKWAAPWNPYHYFAEEIRDVAISYSLDWSPSLPAGSDLGEEFTLYAISPLEYIRRGYTGKIYCGKDRAADTLAVIQRLNGCDEVVGLCDPQDGSCKLIEGNLFDNFYGEPVIRKVSELTEDDLRLVGGAEIYSECILFLLHPESLPDDLSGELTITVTTEVRTYTVPFADLEELVR